MKRFFLAFIKKLFGVRSPSKYFHGTVEHDFVDRWKHDFFDCREKGATND